ncbi:winged helix-turn-helix domain-containing protein [Paenibacillus melissococcoides]|uniref:Winged helix-turn-helix domain-containing protein n=1 Tax=Paenibacillus melissococcoides TaxID=2912268 RepID=A0ABN8U6B0_9BACL|nr:MULTISPECIES: response regulator transcription factor [Paenibacillus]MEB9894535.1 winged helix-turn-helix domain-containing protein [Bacillus cereus]CAH8246647.1 winged helix-turn-helix domain-containing protein [Paenibacillus melissococcoides]CAH8715346.1 winged helix-turn-helix domain-containing protein [Paenibacillus melissococcoides]CAH8716294.1 winged helix-turn-helix domain-containing protein [Paenibacillus melissococcoides]GIO80023.1 hypothetical protein J6TS7_36330 [Paenibacillus de
MGQLKGIKILLVDDEPNILQFLELGLTNEGFEELLARIHARIRNQFPHLFGEVVAGPFRIDDRRKEITYDSRVLELSPTEYELLKFLVLNQGLVLSKAMILDRVWGYDFGGEENIVEVYIRSLREKLNDREHRLIRTLRGAGYRVDLP